MSQIDTSKSWRAYVPAFDDVYTPPPAPTHTEPPPVQSDNAGLGFVVTIANVLMTAIIIAGMLLDGQAAWRAIITGAVYFAITTGLYMLVITGALAAIIATWQREQTERARIDAYADATEMAINWRVRIEKNRTLELQAQAPAQPQITAGGVQTPNGGRTFVPPYDKPSETAREAVDWAYSLYLPSGKPDPEKVQTKGDKRGWLLVRMLGSKRDGGSKEAGLWLLHRKFILPARGGYIVNLNHFPRREHLRTLR